MPYTPDATDVAQPADTGVEARTGAAEFRTLKTYIAGLLAGTIAYVKLAVGNPAGTQQLTVYKGGANASLAQFANGTTGAGAGDGTLFGVTATGDGFISVQDAANSFSLYTNGTQRFTVDPSGNTLIGVGTPGLPFECKYTVSGNVARFRNTGTGVEVAIMTEGTVAGLDIGNASAGLQLRLNTVTKFNIDAGGDIYGIAGSAGMTIGFINLPSAAGAPGTPTGIFAGRVPMYVNESTNELMAYIGGAWKSVTLT